METGWQGKLFVLGNPNLLVDSVSDISSDRGALVLQVRRGVLTDYSVYRVHSLGNYFKQFRICQPVDRCPGSSISLLGSYVARALCPNHPDDFGGAYQTGTFRCEMQAVLANATILLKCAGLC